MLEAVVRHRMRVIPSLLSFEAVAMWPSGVGCGRTDLVIDPAARRWFRESVVSPFLDIAIDVAARTGVDPVLAWEVMNEPGQVTMSASALYLRKTLYPIRPYAMRRFLDEMVDCIGRKGFESTVGHLREHDMGWLPTGSLPQFHYYPQRLGPGLNGRLASYDLPRASSPPAFIGEFASSLVQRHQKRSTRWPEIEALLQEASVLSRIVSRLRLIEAKGYRLALLWPDLTSEVDYDPASPEREPVHFSRAVLEGIKHYLEH
jgi:hypothetical protein